MEKVWQLLKHGFKKVLMERGHHIDINEFDDVIEEVMRKVLTEPVIVSIANGSWSRFQRVLDGHII